MEVIISNPLSWEETLNTNLFRPDYDDELNWLEKEDRKENRKGKGKDETEQTRIFPEFCK